MLILSALPLLPVPLPSSPPFLPGVLDVFNLQISVASLTQATCTGQSWFLNRVISSKSQIYVHQLNVGNLNSTGTIVRKRTREEGGREREEGVSEDINIILIIIFRGFV